MEGSRNTSSRCRWYGASLLPHDRRDDAHEDVGEHEDDALDRYGLYQSTSARSSRNHAPHSCVLKARIRLTTGLATQHEQRPRHAGPEQHREEDADEHDAACRDPAAVMISSHGMPTTSAGLPQLEQRLAAARVALASTRASIEDDGDLRELGRLADADARRSSSQLLELAAVPAPLAEHEQQRRSSTIDEPDTPAASAHSRSRTDARLIGVRGGERRATSQTICDFHACATTVGTSVWPAE